LEVEIALIPAYWLTGQLARAAELGEQSLRHVDESGDVELRAFVRGEFGHVYVSSGAFDPALRLFDEALKIGGDDPGIGMDRVGLATQVWTRSRRGWAQVEMGRLAIGRADLDAGLRRARELGQWEVASWTRMFHVFADEYAGHDPATGLVHARESLEHAERAGSPFAQATAYYTLGRVHLAAGDPHAALEALEQAAALPLSADFEPARIAYVAEAQLGIGSAEAARSEVERAIQMARAIGARGWEARANLVRARVLRTLDGAAARDAIDASLDHAEALIAETGARAQTPFVIEERARLALVLGDVDGGVRLLEDARRAFEAMGAMGHEARLASEGARPSAQVE